MPTLGHGGRARVNQGPRDLLATVGTGGSRRGIFINYRAEDSGSYGALLYLDLSRRFGDDSVFLDSESILAGSNYAEQLLNQVHHSLVLLAVIGPQWTDLADTQGRRRIDDPNDWIRRELAEAFANDVRVVPVLADGADLPARAEVPHDIAMLSHCQYLRLRHRDAKTDLARIADALTKAEPHLAAHRRRRSRVPSRHCSF
jgi:hypothetical protein